MEINVQSDVGRKEMNQDYANVENQQHITFAVLADGMGGHQAGDVSQMAVNNLGDGPMRLSTQLKNLHSG